MSLYNVSSRLDLIIDAIGHDKRQFELELPHQHFRQLCTYVTKAHRGDVKLSKGAVTLLRRASEAWLKCMLSTGLMICYGQHDRLMRFTVDDAYSMQENGVKANPTQAMIRKHLGDVLYWLPAIRSGISPAQ